MPPSILDETMNLATRNIREFGPRESLPQSLHYIAELIGRFDLVALTEVWRNLRDLLRVMDLLPPVWDFVVSEHGGDRAANNDRVAYVCDKRVVRFAGLAAEADPPRNRNKEGRYERGFDRDLIVVGDMDIPSRESELFRAVRHYGLKLPGALAELRESEATTNLSRKAVYDQILHHATNPGRFTDNAGALDFYMGDHRPLYPEIDSLLDFTYQMSDHLPLWIQLDTWIEDEQLDSVLAGCGDAT